MYDLGTYGAEIVISDEKFSKSLKNAEGQIKKTEDQSKKFGSSIGKLMSGTLAKFGGAVAAAFAIDKIKDFGVSVIEAGASSQAMNAQFKQVFGDLQNDAQKTVNQLGKDFGMVPNRIKPAMSQMTSMFKGLGMDTKDAMDQAKTAVTLTADAAAFYDKSFEDAQAALNSFIKGNYEGGESIGLFANETQLASWAAKNLGMDWKNLDEKGKQVARLEFAKSMQKAAGATGQARRESNSYENQLGNLKQSWTDLKAQLAQPIMNTVVNGLKTVSGWLQNIDFNKVKTGVSTFVGYLKDILVPVFNDVKSGLQTLWDKFKDVGGLQIAKSLFEGLKDVFSWLKDNTSIITAALGGLAGAFVAFKVIQGINTAIGIFNGLITAMRTGTLLATLAQKGLNLAFLSSPVGWIVAGIGALIAIIILMAKNWDTVTKKLGELWSWLKGEWNKFTDSLKHGIQAISDGWQKMKDFFVNVANNLWQTTVDKFNAIKNHITQIFNGIESFISNAWSFIKSFFVNGAQTIWQITVDKFNAVKNAITQPIETAKNAVKNAIDKIKGYFSDMWNEASDIMGKIKSAFSNLFTKIKLPHFQLHGSLNPLDWPKEGLPSISVEWKKRGGFFDSPTIVGLGEAGREAIVPLENKRYMAPFADAVYSRLRENLNSNHVINNSGTQINFQNVTIQANNPEDFFEKIKLYLKQRDQQTLNNLQFHIKSR
ncbi:phage tail protein [Tuberibacillus calidus]|uniref:phage tail protein n=1 Tax=Tuberibacillus calidus TaxID=340097 RepID=UPI0004221F99|nr:hypothetical protein [Tuberibacillus calidus]